MIKKALDKALAGLPYYAEELSGVSLEKLCTDYIDKNIPVILWATMGTRAARTISWSYNGRRIEWVQPEHCLLLVGYDEKHYIFNDPQKSGPLTYYTKESVETAYKAQFSQAVVILRKKEEPEEKEIDIEKLNRIDREVLMNSYYYGADYKSTYPSLILSDGFNDFTFLSCLQLLFSYYWDKGDREKADVMFDEMLYLRTRHPDYKKYYSDFLNTKGDFDFGYEYYHRHKKTTRIDFDKAEYFTKEGIQKRHQADDWFIFFASLIPGTSGFFGILAEVTRDIEQNGWTGVSNDIVDGIHGVKYDKIYDELVRILGLPSWGYTALSTFVDFSNTLYGMGDKTKERYNINGTIVQEDDAFIQVTIHYDMGNEYRQFQFYFRNGYPYVTDLEQYVVRWDTDYRSKGEAKLIYDRYKNAKFQPSEMHEPRGPYWPGNE